MKPLVYIAILTGGPDEQEDEVIDFALLDSDGNILLNTAFKPKDDVEGAVYTNGDLAPSPRFKGKALQILGHLSGPVVGGYNTQFAMRFVKKLLKDHIEDDPRLGRLPDVYVDTATVIYEQLGLDSLSLEDACNYVKIPYIPNHSALEDARAARAVYNKVARANWWNRWWWKRNAPS